MIIDIDDKTNKIQSAVCAEELQKQCSNLQAACFTHSLAAFNVQIFLYKTYLKGQYLKSHVTIREKSNAFFNPHSAPYNNK
jgi:hypothetical protein